MNHVINDAERGRAHCIYARRAKLTRRQLIASCAAVSSLPFAASFASRALAQNDLLDPSVLDRRAAPSAPGAGGPSPGAANLPVSAIEARSMASQTESAFLGLLRSLVGHVNNHKRFKGDEEKLKARINQQRDKNERDLNEYRQGLFCSGCGRTRSDILSSGEQFPHRGETIVRPTAAQIAEKAASLQRLVDNLAQGLPGIADSIKKEDALWRLVEEQLTYGSRLWVVAVDLERLILLRLDNRADKAHRAKRDEVLAQVAANLRIIEEQTSPSALQSVASDLEIWRERLREMEVRRALDKRDHGFKLRDQRIWANERARSVITDGSNILSALGMEVPGGALAAVHFFRSAEAAIGSQIAGQGAANEPLGRRFLMGSYGPEKVGTTLGNVTRFCDVSQQFRNSPEGVLPSDTFQVEPALSKIDSAVARIGERMREFPECTRHPPAPSCEL